MANVFISHNSSDVGWAEQIHQWLSEDGHKVFLDSDKDDGIAAGDEWRLRLYERLRWADAVICVVSPPYLTSPWCSAEIGAAQALGSEILPVRVSSESLDDRLLTTKQYVDVVRDASDARDRLRLRLSIIDGTGGRGWPDDASPYPGLRPFQLGEHRVFFGRGREIKEITERLRSPAERGERAVLTVVGPSGCGKSSLVRAGVVPRIAGGDEWLTVPPIVPGSDPMGNLVRAIASLVRERHIDFDLASLRMNLGHSGLKAVATDLLVAAQADNQCKLLIVIDQFEELLTQTEPRERAEFVETIEPTLGGPVQALATMRPEFLDPASKDADLSKLPARIQPVRPLAADALREVIEQPAGVAGLGFEDDLVTRLVTDTGSGDALPLLAFTLEQLADGVRRGGQLTHQRYDEIGGVQGALQHQADAALEEACNKAGVTRAQVISALLDLVTIDAQGRPTKRRAVLDELSSTMVHELEPFVDRRLLSTEAEGERTVVGVAHESFLVNWPPLKDEIDAQAAALRARRVVESAANDWAASGRDKRTLLQGGQLAKASVDIGAELEPVTTSRANVSSGRHWRWHLPTWWPSHRRLVSRVELNDTGREFLEASIRSDRSRRRRQIIQVAAVTVVLAVIAFVAVVRSFQATNAKHQAQASARRAIASRLLNKAADMLAQNKPGGDAQAFQKLLAADALDRDTAANGLFGAVTQRLTTAKIMTTGAPVRSVVFSRDGKRLAGGGDDGRVRLWDANTGQPVRDPLTAHTEGVISLAFSDDGQRITSVGGDNKVQVWNADSGSLVGGGKYVGASVVALSPDGRRLAAGLPTPRGTVLLWNTDNGQPLGAALQSYPDDTSRSHSSVDSVAFSPDGHRLASSGGDDAVRLWDVDSGQLLSPPWPARYVTSMVFSPDGHRLATCGGDGTVQLWNTDNGQPLLPAVPGHSGQVLAVAFSRDGHRLVTGGGDNSVRLWNADNGQPVGAPLVGHAGQVRAVAFSPDGHHVASGADDGSVRLWDADAGRLPGDTRREFSVVFNSDGSQVVSAGLDGVRIQKVDTGETLRTAITGETDGGVLSADGRRLVTKNFGDELISIRVWNAETGQLVQGPLSIPFGTAVALSPDGRKVATATADGVVLVWSADTWPAPPTRMTSQGALFAVAFSPDGHRLATGGADKTVQIWDADNGRAIGNPLKGHTDLVWALAFSRDGHHVVSGGFDRTVQVWDADTGKSLATLAGHTGGVYSVAFSPDGQHVASGGDDKTVRVWDIETGQPVAAPLTGHADVVSAVAFSRDGHQLASASGDGTVRIWPTTATPQMLCDKLTANMNRNQWREWISTDPNIGYRELC